MFAISVTTHFWASHQLRLPDGSTEPAHRHNWVVTARLTCQGLNRMGLVMDFRRVKELLDTITSQLENGGLERVDHFRRNNPSAENVARYIFEKLRPELPEDVSLKAVEVIEEPGCAAVFSGGNSGPGERG